MSNNHVETSSVILIKNPSTDIFANVSTNQKQETELRQKIYGLGDGASCLLQRKSNIFAHNQLNLKTQNAFDLGDSLDKIAGDEEEEDDKQMKTPETPSCANLSSLNERIHKSLSSMTFSSMGGGQNSDCGDSEYGDIFNGFDSADISFANDVKESIFMQSDPFFADE